MSNEQTVVWVHSSDVREQRRRKERYGRLNRVTNAIPHSTGLTPATGKPLAYSAVMRAVLVVNPQATATTSAGRDVLAHALASEVKLEVVETDYRGHALAAAAQAGVDGADLVVAHGGDGTVNEVVNGLLARGPGPTCRCSAWCQAARRTCSPAPSVCRPIPSTPPACCCRPSRHAARAGRPGRLGETAPENADQHELAWFTFNAGVGWDADVVAGVDRKRGKRTSPTLYARVALAEYLRPAHGQPLLTVELPGREPIEGLKLAFVSNTDPWTYLGTRPIHLNPGSTFDRGLGLFALRTLRLPTVVRHLRKALSAKDRQRGGSWCATTTSAASGSGRRNRCGYRRTATCSGCATEVVFTRNTGGALRR